MGFYQGFLAVATLTKREHFVLSFKTLTLFRKVGRRQNENCRTAVSKRVSVQDIIGHISYLPTQGLTRELSKYPATTIAFSTRVSWL